MIEILFFLNLVLCTRLQVFRRHLFLVSIQEIITKERATKLMTIKCTILLLLFLLMYH